MEHDPILRLALNAEEKLQTQDISALTDFEAQLVVMHWGVSRITESNEKLAECIEASLGNGNGTMGKIRRHGPVASIGFGLAALLSFLRDFLAGGS